MPGPKSRVSRSRRGMRRAHDFITPKAVVNCANCGAVVKPHHVCPSCGYYKGKQVVVAQAAAAE